MNMKNSQRVYRLQAKHRRLREQQNFRGQKPCFNLVFFTGAGISQESGIPTFRDQNGIWNHVNNLKFACMESFNTDPAGLLDFYNRRRRLILSAIPSEAHKQIAGFERFFHVTVITQNIDDLHERAGSSEVIHLHGSVLQMRAHGFTTEKYFLPWQQEIKVGMRHPLTHSQLRPNVVLFGEKVQHLQLAKRALATADIVVIIGTSFTVEPAASLLLNIYPLAQIFNINPELNSETIFGKDIHHIQMKASEGLNFLQSQIKSYYSS